MGLDFFRKTIELQGMVDGVVPAVADVPVVGLVLSVSRFIRIGSGDVVLD